MNFGSGRTKAWRDIWGSGQGIAAIDRVVGAAELVDRLAREYAAACEELRGRMFAVESIERSAA
jgi:nitronate monooxygenase